LAFNAPITGFLGFAPLVIGFGNGLGAPLTIAAAGIGLAVFAVGFTAMGQKVENPGGFYAYVTAGLGRPLGLGAALIAITAYLFLLVGGSVYAGISLNQVVTGFGGPELPWQVYVVGLMVIVTALGYFSVDVSVKALVVTMALELLIVVAWDVKVLSTGGAQGVSYEPLNITRVLDGAPGLAILFALLLYSGFEATAIFREEAKDPVRTIPRATYITVGLVGFLYALSTFAMITGFGPDKAVDVTAADAQGNMIGAVEFYLGHFMHQATLIILMFSILAAVIAQYTVNARYIFCLSVDRIFPQQLSYVNPKQGSPFRSGLLVTAVWLVSLAAITIADVDPIQTYAALVGISGYAVLLLIMVTSFAVIAYFVRHQAPEMSMFRTRVAPVLAAVIMVGALALSTRNIELLIGGSHGLAVLLLVVIYGILATGVIAALALRNGKPDTYQRIGRQSPEGATQPTPAALGDM